LVPNHVPNRVARRLDIKARNTVGNRLDSNARSAVGKRLDSNARNTVDKKSDKNRDGLGERGEGNSAGAPAAAGAPWAACWPDRHGLPSI
jgi:hypothetical protein